MKLKKIVVSMFAAGIMASSLAHATNGYFSHGYGMKAKGMGGAATAMAIDTFAGANNPASMVWVGDRLDIGVDLFNPQREASRQGSTGFGGAYDGTSVSGSNYFLVPEFGYNKLFKPNLSFGVTVYGNGGMNSDYGAGVKGGAAAPAFAPSCAGAPSNLLFGCGKLGVDLMQLIVAPTASYKLNESHSIGISPLFGYQRFKVDGLQTFEGFTSSPGNVTNNGYDSSTGWGVRVGWFGKISDTVTLGAAYATKMKMGKFSKYSGLFAEQGSFDIPENYNVGIAVKATPALNLAFDIQQINYADVKSIANGVANTLLAPATSPLGSTNGSGFNWSNQTVYKLGMEYDYSSNLVLRAGYNYGKSPIRGDTINDVTFNILAPGVVEHHLTLGSTWMLADKSELTMSYMHAFSKSVTGPSVTSLLGVGGTETLTMKQNSLGIAYSIKLE